MKRITCGIFLFLAVLLLLPNIAFAQHSFSKDSQDNVADRPWMNKTLSPDERADLVLKQLTLEEKLQFLHGNGMRDWGKKPNPNWYLGNGGAGFVLGVPRLGIPIIQMTDAAYGVRSSAENGRYSTALPSDLASAASWDSEAACEYGALIGREIRAQGFNMTLGGGVNLAREPRNGRTFEYLGEDPILAGTMVGNRIKCEQAQHVIGDIKHFVANDQESGRTEVNVIIGKRALRETDLLAFEIGIAIGQPGAVMCSYNVLNGDYACENKYLLNDVLKKDWKFPGFVVSDWGATHSTVKASAAGLDTEQPEDRFYGEKYKSAVESGQIRMSELDDHVRRILRSEFASGIVDYPVQKAVVDVEAGFETSRKLAEQSIVLLKNDNNTLPLNSNIRSIAIIGERADFGMLSGAGSAQVDPPGPPSKWNDHVWFPTSPLKAIRAKVSGSKVEFDSGVNPESAATLAKRSDIAIVFANQWTSEGMDLPNLSLPGNQNALITQVAAANPKTIVVLENGTAVTMPWLERVAGVLVAWYPGNRGADALANILFGDVNPSAKLPITFPRSESDLPHPTIAVPPGKGNTDLANQEAKATFSVHYDEGLKVGYKWYDAENKAVLFPFGYGLSYTTFAYSDLKVQPGVEPTVEFTVRNTGHRDGAEIAQVYVLFSVNAGEPPKRLVAFKKISIPAGQSKQVKLIIDRKYLSIFDEAENAWKLVPGSYTFKVGGSSQDLPLSQAVTLQ